MKSIRLSNDIRDNIILAMVAACKKNNPEPYDLKKERECVGETLWNDLYGHLSFNKIPDTMLRIHKVVKISIRDKVSQWPLTISRPVKAEDFSKSVDAVYDEAPGFILDYWDMAKAWDKWDKALTEFQCEITQIIYSVNTTKQLVDLWPEAEDYLPAFANDPSKGINLPALKTSRLNEALGIKENK
jgi:hypothetical protein